jgi:hypothetical protein
LATKKNNITNFDNCKLIGSDVPDIYIYNYINNKIFKLGILNFCELIFGYKEKNISSNLYIGMNNLKDTFYLAKKKGDLFNKNILFTKNDKISRELNVKKFDNYIAKLIEQNITKNDTLYKVEFTEKPTVHLSSHMKFYPLKELFISFSTGIQKVIIENKCYKVIYE